MRKKIIIILSVISLFIVILSLSVFASEEENYTFEENTVITLNNTMPYKTLNILAIVVYDANPPLHQYNTSNIKQIQFNSSTFAITRTNDTYTGNINLNTLKDRQITILSGQTINQDYITYLENNTDFVIPRPSPAENAYNASSNLISSSFYSIGQVINFISNNAVVCVCTVGILIVSFVVGLLHRFKKRTFKTK